MDDVVEVDGMKTCQNLDIFNGWVMDAFLWYKCECKREEIKGESGFETPAPTKMTAQQMTCLRQGQKRGLCASRAFDFHEDSLTSVNWELSCGRKELPRETSPEGVGVIPISRLSQQDTNKITELAITGHCHMAKTTLPPYLTSCRHS